MPIRSEHRWLYPIDWPQISASIRFARAKGLCEHCGRRHLAHIAQTPSGVWWDADRRLWRDSRGRTVAAVTDGPIRFTRTVLACAHLNHDPTDNRGRNLAALCQRCHLAHDREEHRRRRWQNRFTRGAWRDLFAV